MPEYSRHRSHEAEVPVELEKSSVDINFVIQSSVLRVDQNTGNFIEGFMDFVRDDVTLRINASEFNPCVWSSNGRFYVENTYAIPIIRAHLKRFIQQFGGDPGKPTKFECTESLYRSSMSDTPTPGFKRRSSRGEVIASPMKSTIYEVKVSPGLVNGSVADSGFNVAPMGTASYLQLQASMETTSSATQLGLASSDILDLVSKLPDAPPAYIGNAVNQAFSNITAGTLESLVTLAEADKTASHLAATAVRIVSIIRSIKSGNFRSIAPDSWHGYLAKKKRVPNTDIAEFFASAWLEARYAWRPLIIDAQAVVSLLTEDKQLHPRQTFRGTDNSSDSEVISDAGIAAAHGFFVTGSGTVDHNSTVRAGVLCQAKTKNGLPRELGVLNFATLVWELVPYSFVANWFIDVSGLLSKLTASATYDTLSSWAVVSHETKATYTFDRFDSQPLEVPLVVEVNRIVKTRVIGVREFNPSILLNLDVPKLIDAAALMRRFI